MSHIPDSRTLTGWVVTDGRRGIENQALGLAEAMARQRPLNISTKVLPRAGLMDTLTPASRTVLPDGELPDIWIACGRASLKASIKVRDASKHQTFTVQVQDPRMDVALFDAVIPPAHDSVRGPNVISMLGSPNRITPQTLDAGAYQFAGELNALPAPRAAVLIGGNSKKHTLDASACMQHCSALQTLARQGYSIMLTTSRRTPDSALKAYQGVLSDTPNVWIWDGAGENPYFAFLSAADVILVSEDSTNMITEACATGKPVFRLPMSGRPGKFQHLYDALQQRCNVRPFDGNLDANPYTPLNETERVARALWALFDAHRKDRA